MVSNFTNSRSITSYKHKVNREKTPNLQWTSTDADSKAMRAAIQAEPAKILWTYINQPLSPKVDTEVDMLLRLPPPHDEPPCLCQFQIQ